MEYNPAIVDELDRRLRKPAAKRELKKAEIVELIANHLLVEGFRDDSIRTLAAAIGTSDRMLLYYFENKGNLMEAILEKLTSDFSEVLDKLVGKKKLTADQLLAKLSRKMYSKDMRPMLKLWFEIIGRALRGEEPYRSIAKQMMEEWEAWIKNALVQSEEKQAAELFAQLEGRIMIRLLTE